MIQIPVQVSLSLFLTPPQLYLIFNDICPKWVEKGDTKLREKKEMKEGDRNKFLCANPSILDYFPQQKL